MNKSEDLLQDLNEIIDICVGNEKPTDVAYGERSTLPEILSHAMLYPGNIEAVRDAKHKVLELTTLIGKLSKKIEIMHTKIALKNKEYQK